MLWDVMYVVWCERQSFVWVGHVVGVAERTLRSQGTVKMPVSAADSAGERPRSSFR